MWKSVAIVAVSAALGEYGARKYGATIEARATAMKLPPAVAHAVVVGSAAALGFLIISSIV